ncbi:MAG: rane protein, partial [Mycobacterium sp.]|nr:rane protein [Mycobacterium sp.]
SGLGFVAQTVVVMPVVLLLAYAVAVVLDGALGNGIRLLQRARHTDEDPS